MSLWYNTMTVFSFFPDEARETACTEYEVITNIYSDVKDSKTVKWDDEHVQLAYDRQSPSQGDLCYPIAESSSKKKRGDGIRFERPDLNTESTSASNMSLPAQTDGLLDLSSPAQVKSASTLKTHPGTVFETNAKLLDNRQTGSMLMPAWGYLPDTSVDPNNYMPKMENLFSNSDPKFKCSNCADCAEDESDLGRCCGCVSMDYRYPNYDDIPYCENCNRDDKTDGSWPGNIFIKSRDSNKTLDGLSDTGEDLSEEDYHILDERTQGVATLSYKKVTVCGTKYSGGGNSRYPAFPAGANNPWETPENADYVAGISKYWGNSSDFCSNWGVTNRLTADTVIIPSSSVSPTRVRAKYNSKSCCNEPARRHRRAT